MNDQLQKRRGPLLWMADWFRRRPVMSVALTLLLLMLAAVSTIGTALILRQQRAQEQRLRAVMQLELAQQAQLQFMRQMLEERQPQPEQPGEEKSDGEDASPTRRATRASEREGQ